MTRPGPARPPCCAYVHACATSASVRTTTLAFAGRAHHRLDDARQADLAHGLAILALGVGEAVGRGRQPSCLGGEPADAFAIHGQSRGARGRDDGEVLRLLELDQRRRRDRLDLRHDQVRPFALDDCAQRCAVEHVDDVRAMRDLHRRRVRVAIDRDHFAAEALQLDRDFLAELAGAEQHDARAGRRQRGTDGRHSRSFLCRL